MPHTAPIFRYRIFGALFLLFVLLMHIQLFTLETLKSALLGDLSVSAYDVGIAERAGTLVRALGPADWVAAAGIAAVLLWLVLTELRGGGISRELETITASGTATLVLLGLLSVIAARCYLSPGALMLGDSTLHAQRAWGAARSLSEGRFPYWSFFNYCGYPFLQFYGPLFYLVTAVTEGLFGGIEWSIKAWLFLFHAGSSLPVYLWSRASGAKRTGALVAGTAYVLTFHHTHTVVWTGALQMSAVFFLFPFLLLALEKAASRRSAAWMYAVALVTAALTLTHQGYAVYGLQLAAVYLLLRLAFPGRGRPGPRIVLASAACMAFGVLLSSIFLWPALFGNESVYWPVELPLLRPAVPTLAFIRRILVWRNMWSGWTSSYMGVSLLALAAAGPVLVWRRSGGSRQGVVFRAAAVTAAFSLLCAAYSGRVSNLSLPFLAVLAGGAVELTRRPTAGRPLAILLAALALDLGPTTVQSPYRRDLAFISEGLQAASDEISPHRAIYGYTSPVGTEYFYWADGRLTDLVLPTGFFPQGSPHTLNAVTAALDRLNGPEAALDEELGDLLYLWDVAGLLTYTRDRFVPPGIPGSAPGRGPVPIARIEPASPLLYAQRIAAAPDDTLERLQEEEFLQRRGRDDPSRRAFLRRMIHWVALMGIDRAGGLADVIYLAAIDDGWSAFCREYAGSGMPGGSVSGGAADALSAQGGGTGAAPAIGARVLDYAVDMYRVSMRYRCGGSGFLRLAFSWYPTLTVLIDGDAVPSSPSLLGAIVIPTRAGEHTIELVPSRPIGAPPVILTISAVVLLPLVVRASTRRPRRRRTGDAGVRARR